MSLRKFVWSTVGVAAALVACVGDNVVADTSSSGAPGASSSGAPSSSGEPGASSSGEVGASSSSGSVTNGCDGNDLVIDGTRSTCALGCKPADTESARCKVFEPRGPATAADLLRGGLGALTLRGGDVVDVLSGQIKRGDTLLRQANTDAADQVINNIAFRIVGEGDNRVAVLVAKSILITGVSREDRLQWVGTVDGVTNESNAAIPVVLVAQDDLKVETALPLPCGQLGGFVGGGGSRASRVGGGPGGGNSNEATGTGAGGSHGTKGGNGSGTPTSGPGSQSVYNGTFELRGGSGGGGGRMLGEGVAPGGSGGAALGLVAGKALWIGDGTDGHGISAGGCGADAINISGRPAITSGGGGAGGFLSLESPIIHGAAGAGLAANGGGGAGWNSTGGGARGQHGALSITPAAGGGPGVDGCQVAGGNGAAGDTAATSASNTTVGCATPRGAGGGGGLGRIVLGTANNGQLEVPANATFILSPSAAPALQRFTIDVEN